MLRSRVSLLLVSLACACGSSATDGPGGGGGPGGDCSSNLDCPIGQICDASGTCVDDGSGGGGDCPGVAVTLTPVEPVVQILIDQSGSMTEDFGQIGGVTVDRWEAERYALTDPTVGAVTLLEDRVRFGAVLYHSEGGNAGGTCPMLAHTTGTPAGFPVLGNAAAIRDLFANNSPNQDTPTAEAVDAVHAEILSYPVVDADQRVPLVMILSTDGNPDNCENADAHNLASQQLSEAAVERTFADGIKVVPLSVGSDVSDAHMQRLANAGSGLALDASPGAPWYRGNDPQELVDAFNEIIRGVRNCVVTLNGTADPADAADATVTLNGTDLVYGVDWTMLDGSTIELLGGACQTFLETDVVDLDAIFACGTIID